ncbi:LON peptidase substrate-binding domain-containing protein [Agarivorans sp. QJM3NY_33]|uniref:LON peptidase substrate-binding domain-containing protein n=1 Tax=Agarivorans sp. QJM3NY_33 TaxID=3421432 RepID=UPI003D7D7216
MRLPLFPLALFMLPGGRSKLRIFEPRYLRLVALASENQQGFVLCQPTHNNTDNDIGVLCLIEDFEQLKDGMLGISIQAIERVSITDISQADDNLLSGLILKIPEWEDSSEAINNQQMTSKLKEVLERHPIYKQHPDYLDYEDPRWVVLRWLELLPFSTTAKNQILKENNFPTLSNLVLHLLPEIDIDED